MAINYAEKYASKIDERFSKEAMSTGAVNQDYDFVGVKTVHNIFDEAVTTIKIDTEAVTEEKLAPDVTAKLHTHTNKTVIDGITEERVSTWDSIKEQVSRTQLDEAIAAEAAERTESDNAIKAMLNAAKAYLEDMCFSFTDEFQRVYTLVSAGDYQPLWKGSDYGQRTVYRPCEAWREYVKCVVHGIDG